jgi:hypothetical protein
MFIGFDLCHILYLYLSLYFIRVVNYGRLVGWAQMRVWGVMALEREPWLEYAARARCYGLSLRLVDLYPAPGMSVSKSAAWCSWGRCCGVSGAWRMRVMT